MLILRAPKKNIAPKIKVLLLARNAKSLDKNRPDGIEIIKTTKYQFIGSDNLFKILDIIFIY